MSSCLPTTTRFSVTVVGAGITGLAVGLHLAQDGHDVRIIERRKEGFAASLGGGIGLTVNATRIIEAMGLKDQFLEISDTHPDITVRKYSTGEVMRTIHKRHPSSMLHRADVVRLFYHAAVQLGVDVQFGKAVVAIDDSGTRPKVHLDDGSVIESDLVLGADGIESKIRKIMFPKADPQMRVDCCFLVSIPRSAMEKYAETSALYGLPNYQIWLGPGRDIVGWTMTKREVYHLQFSDHQYGLEDRSLGSWTQPFQDVETLRRRWADFEPAIQLILAESEDWWKWKIAEVPELPKWSNERGNVILMGDAAHAISPFAGQGAAQGIEDGAALAELVANAASSDDIPEIARLYGAVRKPRVRGILEIVRANTKTFSMPDGQEQEERDRMLRGDRRDRLLHGISKGKGNWGSAEHYKWIDEYDAAREARDIWLRRHTARNESNAKL